MRVADRSALLLFQALTRMLMIRAGLVAIDILAQLYAAHEHGDAKAGVNIEASSR